MKIHKYSEAQFSPAAPVVKVTLHNEETNRSLSDVLMQLDTGADISLIPQSTATELNLPIVDRQISLITFDGTESSYSLFQVKLQLDRYTFRGIYSVVEQDYGIIGRDILNLLPILFDGPQQEWKIAR